MVKEFLYVVLARRYAVPRETSIDSYVKYAHGRWNDVKVGGGGRRAIFHSFLCMQRHRANVKFWQKLGVLSPLLPSPDPTPMNMHVTWGQTVTDEGHITGCAPSTC